MIQAPNFVIYDSVGILGRPINLCYKDHPPHDFDRPTDHFSLNCQRLSCVSAFDNKTQYRL